MTPEAIQERSGRPAERRAAWLLLSPALGAIALFFAVPLIAALLLSLTDFDIYALADPGNLRFVGFGNYAALLHDPLFWKALGNTLYFVVVGVPLSIVVSLAAALLLHSKLARLPDIGRPLPFEESARSPSASSPSSGQA